MNLELYHPIFFTKLMLVPEFLELIRTNKHRLDAFLDVFISGPNEKTHSYVALMAPPTTLPIVTATTGFHVAYILPLMGVTSFDPTYKGMGQKIRENITTTALLFDFKPKSVETVVAPQKPLKEYNDYLEWWKETIKDIQTKI